MSIEIKVNKLRGFLSYAAPAAVKIEPIKSRRRRLNNILQKEGMERLLFDLRLVQSLKIIDADNLAGEFRDDIPACRKLAVVRNCSQSMMHYQNVTNIHNKDMDIEFFDSLQEAQIWLQENQ